MFQLKLANNDVTSGSLPVTWCVDPEDLKVLADRKVVDPQVVIVVSPVDNYHKSHEYRKVVPLKDLMTYIEFRSSGKNRVWAFISFKKPGEARSYYTAKSGGEYATDILEYTGDNWSWMFNNQHPEMNATTLEVEVPQGAFAKEPPKWEKAWVNHWFRSKPIDQCDYRRRRLLAYTVQPLVMLLNVVVVRTILFLVACLWWSRGLSFKYHLHPLRYDLEDTCELVKGGSWCVAHLPEDDESSNPEITFSYLLRKLWKVPLMPVIAVPVLLALHFHVLGYVGLGVAILATVIFLVFFVATGGASWLGEVIVNAFRGGEPEAWYLNQEEIEAVTCNSTMEQRTTISALPAKHRTFRLRFQNLKSKVCRPFSA